MDAMLIVIIIFGLLCFVCVCKAVKKSEKPLKTAFLSASCGICALCAVNFLALYTGVSISVNFFTSFVSVVLGAPGVICILLLNMIF